MPVKIEIPNMDPIYLEKENSYYTYCHGFTKDVILGIFLQRKLDYRLRKYRDELVKIKDGTENNIGILSLYIDMSLALGGHRIFNQTNMASVIQGPGLILFASQPLDPMIEAKQQTDRIQHSMIALKWNEWQGANNISSLGIVNPEIDPVNEDRFVLTFPNMDVRKYQPNKSGGWYNEEDDQIINKKIEHEMYSIYDPKDKTEPYTMYYVPLCEQVKDDGCYLLS